MFTKALAISPSSPVCKKELCAPHVCRGAVGGAPPCPCSHLYPGASCRPPRQDLALLLCQDSASPAPVGAGGARGWHPMKKDLPILPVTGHGCTRHRAHPATRLLVGNEVGVGSIRHTAWQLWPWLTLRGAEHPFPAQPITSTCPSSPPRHRLALCSPLLSLGR